MSFFVIDSFKWFSEIGFFLSWIQLVGSEFLRTEQFVEIRLAQKKMPQFYGASLKRKTNFITINFKLLSTPPMESFPSDHMRQIRFTFSQYPSCIVCH